MITFLWTLCNVYLRYLFPLHYLTFRSSNSVFPFDEFPVVYLFPIFALPELHLPELGTRSAVSNSGGNQQSFRRNDCLYNDNHCAYCARTVAIIMALGFSTSVGVVSAGTVDRTPHVLFVLAISSLCPDCAL